MIDFCAGRREFENLGAGSVLRHGSVSRGLDEGTEIGQLQSVPQRSGRLSILKHRPFLVMMVQYRIVEATYCLKYGVVRIYGWHT